MKIAVTYQDGNIFEHFGHTKQFKIYEISDTEILNQEIIDVSGEGHEALAKFLADLGVEEVICGGIGGGAINALKKAGIKIYGTNKGDCDNALIKLMNGLLEQTDSPSCNHNECSGECHTTLKRSL